MLLLFLCFSWFESGSSTDISRDTLSLQGNVIQKPTEARALRVMAVLKDCAGECMFDTHCQMVIFDQSRNICRIATATSDSEIMELSRYQFAYVRGVECAQDRAMSLQTRKLGLYTEQSNPSSFLFKQIYSPQSAEWKPEDQGICYSISNPRDCPLVSFGSADGGKRLTKDRKLSNYSHYGFCAPTQGVCGANIGFYERDSDGGYFSSSDWGTAMAYADTELFFCFFWVDSRSQCTKAMNSDPFTYNFRMGY